MRTYRMKDSFYCYKLPFAYTPSQMDLKLRYIELGLDKRIDRNAAVALATELQCTWKKRVNLAVWALEHGE